ncbi:MAG: phenylacetic acid degradation protein [Desulfotomaculum sp. BICA1-6]|nr:MAG: phenylacetic acid degradation protein [Desulfotomaculum sp. BICA1-6]
MNGITDKVLEKMRHDPFPEILGVELIELAPGYARVSLTLDEKMTNIHHITHGGVVFTVADVALGLASNSHGPSAVAVNVNINYIRPSKPGDILTATAREEHLGRRTASYRIKVEDQQGKLVATVQGLVYRNAES